MKAFASEAEVRAAKEAVRRARGSAKPGEDVFDAVVRAIILSCRMFHDEHFSLATPVTLDVLAALPPPCSIVWLIDTSKAEPKIVPGKVREYQPQAEPSRVAVIPLPGTQTAAAARWHDLADVYITLEHAHLALAREAEDERFALAHDYAEALERRDHHLAAAEAPQEQQTA